MKEIIITKNSDDAFDDPNVSKNVFTLKSLGFEDDIFYEFTKDKQRIREIVEFATEIRRLMKEGKITRQQRKDMLAKCLGFKNSYEYEKYKEYRRNAIIGYISDSNIKVKKNRDYIKKAIKKNINRNYKRYSNNIKNTDAVSNMNDINDVSNVSGVSNASNISNMSDIENLN